MVVLVDQVAALQKVDELIEAQLWREDRRAHWGAVLRALAYGMDWTTGLVCGITRAQLGATAECAERTVSKVIAWAEEKGLLVTIECGATGEFLGADTNRAPTYAFVAPQAAAKVAPEAATNQCPGRLSNAGSQAGDDAAATAAVEEIGNPPSLSGSEKPLADSQRPKPPRPRHIEWPKWQAPTSPSERNAAVTTVLRRIGLGGRRVPVWRARALLHRWWASGVCVMGILHMLEHHPDGGQARGDIIHGATDPVRVMGARLRPWIGRLDELPPQLRGRYGNYQAAQAASLQQRITAAENRDTRLNRRVRCSGDVPVAR
jgi:hypothetical protein